MNEDASSELKAEQEPQTLFEELSAKAKGRWQAAKSRFGTLTQWLTPKTDTGEPQTMQSNQLVSPPALDHAEPQGSPAANGGSSPAKAALFLDAAGNIVAAQPRCAACFGWDPDALVGNNLMSLLKPGFQQEVTRILENGEAQHDEASFYVLAHTVDGSEFPAQLTFRHLPDNPGFCWTVFVQPLAAGTEVHPPEMEMQSHPEPALETGTVSAEGATEISAEAEMAAPEPRNGSPWRNSLLSNSVRERERQRFEADAQEEGAESARLEQRVQELLAALEQSKADGAATAEERVRQACQEHETRAAQLEQQLATLQQMTDDLGKQLELAEHSAAGAGERMRQMQDELRESAAQLEKAKVELSKGNQGQAEENGSLGAELGRVRENEAALQRKTVELERRMQETASALPRVTAELQKERAERERIERKAHEFEAALEQSKLDAATADDRVQQARQEHETRTAQLEQQLAALQQKNQELGKELEHARQQPAAESGERMRQMQDEWRQSAAQLEKAKAELSKENQSLTEENGGLKTELARVRGNEAALQRKAAELERRVREGVSALARVTAELQQERGDRQRAEECASSAGAHLQQLNEQLAHHIQSEQASHNLVAALEKAIQERVDALARANTDLQREAAMRKSAEERARQVCELGSRLEASLAAVEQAKGGLKTRQTQMEERLEAAEKALADAKSRLEKESSQRLRAEDLLADAQQRLQAEADSNKVEISRLQAALELGELERKRLEGELLSSREVSMTAEQIRYQAVDSLRREVREPIEDLRHSACRLLQGELPEEQKAMVNAMLEQVLLVQASMNASDSPPLEQTAA